MRICIIGKYPPIEGGGSSTVYWLTRELGRRGHTIHIVTNAWEVESEFIENFEVDDLKNYQPKGITVHSTSPFLDHKYIPSSNPYTEKLANETIEVIKKFDLQLIDSFYLLPYGIAGFLAKIFTNRPQILRHAGSDITRLYRSPFLNTLFSEVFQKVDKIVTYSGVENLFSRLGVPKSKIFLDPKVSVDTTAFSPSVKPFDLSKYGAKRKTPVITYIGKIARSKGIYELIEALGKIKKEFVFLLVVGGRRKDLLEKALTRSRLKSKTILLGFIPPWKIPSIIKVSTCVVHPEREFPISRHTPILPREVMAMGRCLILSKELYDKRHSPKIIEGKNVLVVNPKDINSFRKTLEMVIGTPQIAEKIGNEAWKTAKKIEDFKGYVNEIEQLYEDVIKTHKK